MMLRFLAVLLVTLCGNAAATASTANSPIVLTHQLPKWAQGWSLVSAAGRATILDDDIQRHATDPAYWNGITISEKRFLENGFEWHLLRFRSIEKNPYSVIWVIPHDDEDAAFEAAIAAVKKHGGMAIVVNSGPGNARTQAGLGKCGGRSATVKFCDPNRNFSAATPLFTSAILDHYTDDGQPIIALHTNGAGAAGDFSLLDIEAYKRGRVKLRPGAYRAVNPLPPMENYDTLGLVAYRAQDGGPSDAAIACQKAINDAGIHFWHEKVTKTDSSLSNYLALERPDIAYFNAESREEANLSLSASRHSIMIDAYLSKCTALRNQPTPGP